MEVKYVVHCEACARPITGAGVWSSYDFNKGWHIGCAPPVVMQASAALVASRPPASAPQPQRKRCGPSNGVSPARSLDHIIALGLAAHHEKGGIRSTRFEAVRELGRLRGR